MTLTPAIVDGASAFSLWRLPGSKRLIHDGRRLLLRMTLGRRVVHVAVSLLLGEGAPFAYTAPAGARLQRTLRAADQLDAALGDAPRQSRGAAVTRSELVHMRALQVLDADHDGASEHDIAELVFGVFEEPESWNDSAIRANVRYLLDHGRAFRDGGYRGLLYPKPPKRKAALP